MAVLSYRKNRKGPWIQAAVLAAIGAGATYDLSRSFDWIWVVYVVLVGFAGLHVAFEIARPDLLVRDATIGFRPWSGGAAALRPWHWTRIPIARITEVREGIHPVRGFKREFPKPTFYFRTGDGREFEYFPDEHPGKTVDEIRGFLSKVPGLPPLSSGSRV